MTPNQVLKYFKTQTAAARAAGRTQPCIANWVARGAVPHLAQLQLEAVTAGKLKASKRILHQLSQR